MSDYLKVNVSLIPVLTSIARGYKNADSSANVFFPRRADGQGRLRVPTFGKRLCGI
ncbi:phage-like protein [Escherichia coli]|uniref:hypothetical protein n=1 Tax=Escherichia coli TaxID=562 RepID=UPI000DFB742A|nr:hypothetical protein [Escherichia coli]STJ83864.1 phage-like protein [Escherichia coli]